MSSRFTGRPVLSYRNADHFPFNPIGRKRLFWLAGLFLDRGIPFFLLQSLFSAHGTPARGIPPKSESCVFAIFCEWRSSRVFPANSERVRRNENENGSSGARRTWCVYHPSFANEGTRQWLCREGKVHWVVRHPTDMKMWTLLLDF